MEKINRSIFSDEVLTEIETIVKDNRSFLVRFSKLKELGYQIREVPCKFVNNRGVCYMKDEIRVKISAQNGRYKYAYCVIFR